MDEIQNIFSMSKEKETKTAEETEAMTPKVETASTAKETTEAVAEETTTEVTEETTVAEEAPVEEVVAEEATEETVVEEAETACESSDPGDCTQWPGKDIVDEPRGSPGLLAPFGRPPAALQVDKTVVSGCNLAKRLANS